MAIVERMRGTWRWLATARAVRRLRAPGPGAAAPAPPGPVEEPRAAVRRPARDAALLSRLGRWRRHDGPLPRPVPARMTSRERAAAMHDLRALRDRLDGEQAALIDAALASGTVELRRLGPGDGHLWQVPGMRVFAIVGVQAFTVPDEPGASGPRL